VTIENVTYDCSTSCVLEDYLEIVANRKRDDSLHQFEKSLMERNLIYTPTPPPSNRSFSTTAASSPRFPTEYYPSQQQTPAQSPRSDYYSSSPLPALYLTPRKETMGSFNPISFPSAMPTHAPAVIPQPNAFFSSMSSSSSSFSEDSFMSCMREDSFDSKTSNPFDCFSAVPQNSFDWLRGMTQE
jgi:hypothetical protein